MHNQGGNYQFLEKLFAKIQPRKYDSLCKKSL